MKQTWLLTLFLLATIGVYAQPNYQWSVDLGFGAGEVVEVDQLGNIYVLSEWFAGQVVRKYDSNHNLLWLQSLNGSAMLPGKPMAIDNHGNAFAVGPFVDTMMVFGADTLIVGQPWGGASYVTKIDGGGNFVWARAATGTADIVARAVATDPSGNVLVFGYFTSDSAVFGSHTIFHSDIGWADMNLFLAKYDPDGNELWASSVGTHNQGACAYGIATDSDGNTYVTTGMLNDTLVIGTDTLINPAPSNYYSMLLIKFSPAGNPVWARCLGNNGVGYGRAVATDATNHVYALGQYLNGAFLTKLDADGTVIWSNTGIGTPEAHSVAVDENQNAYVSGNFFTQSINIGSFQILGHVTGASPNDMFLAKFDANGGVVWAEGIGGDKGEIAYSMASDRNGSVFMTGSYESTPIVIGNDTLTVPNGGMRMFLTKLSTMEIPVSNQNVSLHHISIYPNPFSTAATLETDQELEGAHILVYNAMGQEAMEIGNVSGRSITLQRGDLPSGFYSLIIQKDQKPAGRAVFIVSE